MQINKCPLEASTLVCGLPGVCLHSFQLPWGLLSTSKKKWWEVIPKVWKCRQILNGQFLKYQSANWLYTTSLPSLMWQIFWGPMNWGKDWGETHFCFISFPLSFRRTLTKTHTVPRLIAGSHHEEMKSFIPRRICSLINSLALSWGRQVVLENVNEWILQIFWSPCHALYMDLEACGAGSSLPLCSQAVPPGEVSPACRLGDTSAWNGEGSWLWPGKNSSIVQRRVGEERIH